MIICVLRAKSGNERFARIEHNIFSTIILFLEINMYRKARKNKSQRKCKMVNKTKINSLFNV